MEAVLIVLGLLLVLMLVRRPAATRDVVYIPVEVPEQPRPTGCLPLLLLFGLLIVLLVVMRQ